MSTNFEYESVKFSSGNLSATILDKDDQPNRVIDREMGATIEVKWNLVTTDPWILIGTTFHLSASAEAIGSAEVIPLGKKDVPVVAGPLNWTEKMDLDTSKIPEGAYKIVVLLTHTAPYPNSPDVLTRLAGFYELPMVQFYSHTV
jgi:hypothetical protein